MSNHAPGRIFVLSGPPGAGKTTLSRAAAELSPRSMAIPVDDIREWVISGLVSPIDTWTPETTLQFHLAEDAAADAARRYCQAGFDVFLDHCRIPRHIDEWIARSLASLPVTRVALVPQLEVNLSRNAARTNKYFDPRLLDPVIVGVHEIYAQADLSGWIVLDDLAEPDEWARRILGLANPEDPAR